MDDNDYEVGYGKPPKEHRFKKGRSGNPKGRPKGALNIASVIDRVLQEKVVINENGERKTISKLEASIKQLVNKAASGDMRAFQQLPALARYAEGVKEAAERHRKRPVEDMTDEELIEIARGYKP
jgi:phosphoenolpyruvate carboxylase